MCSRDVPRVGFKGYRLNLFRRKKETMARLPQFSQIPARIVVQDYRQVDLVFEILLDGFNCGDLSSECNIEDVCRALWPETDAVSFPQFDSEHTHTGCFGQLRIPTVHSVPPAGRRPRSAPCSFINCSGASASVLSRICRVRSSPSRTSRFSSSVKVSTRNVRISSISVESKKSPALSAATCG